MTKTNDPAFPLCNSHIEHIGTNWETANGMSLRDYFAAKAIPSLDTSAKEFGLSTICSVIGVTSNEYSDIEHWPIFVSVMAYRYADAMLKARK
jgi:hypothetical protein